MLITGESGVGKDVIARYVHVNSARAAQRFVALNCASVTETLLESELFGHVKGSFTGAYRDKVGKLQQAHKGTIFLDEIGEMSLRMQAMLLRFLENGEVVPVGSDMPATRVDVRVISATNRNLQDMVAKGTFREDLLYRINVGQIEVPPLRDRREDIRAARASASSPSHGRTVTVDAEAMEALERYRWPGNVRELQNIVEQMLALADGDRMGTELLPPTVTARAGKSPHPVRERRRRGRRRALRRAHRGRLQLLERRLSDVHEPRPDARRPARADPQGPRRDQGQLPRAAAAVRSRRRRLQAAAQLPGVARVRDRLPRVPDHQARTRRLGAA